MPPLTEAETIRILIATDNHVGYEERDPIRKDDSWKSFHEIMCLAKDEDVDMVLLAGDLFHDNKPSRKAMYQVMRSLRMNCLGDKPCELEMLSDANDVFEGSFNHVNYEDPDINVAIPVFSIHGNHDDPTGDGHLSSLDLLQVSGLVNYFGRTPESDNISVKPVLLQKGSTKLALYGMSNVRDERLFRTFRDGKVRFFRPGIQQTDWFNLLAVHQNHHAHTETGYLPENFLPEFMDLVVWGHEHECLIDPRRNPEMGFDVMQPGSSVATSLVAGEAVAKHVAILSVTGKDYKVQKHRIKSIRPFVTREIVLANEKRFKGLETKKDNKQEVTRKLMEIVEELIEEATKDWLEAQGDEPFDEIPLPLVRLRVEYSAADGGRFDCENPQRFSNRFVGKVANVNDVVQFYRKKSGTRKTTDAITKPDEAVIAALSIDNVKVEQLVREFLTAQSLKILPQAPFGDAVSQFVDKDDKHAMESFVNESLAGQVKQMLDLDNDDSDLETAMEQHKEKLEQLFAAGALKRKQTARRFKPRPETWDSDLDGEWEDQPGALAMSDAEDAPTGRASTTSARGRERATTTRGSIAISDDEEVFPAPKKTAAKRAPAKKAATTKTTTAKTTAKRQPASKAPARGRKKKDPTPSDDEDVEDEPDVIMVDDDGDDLVDMSQQVDDDDNEEEVIAPSRGRGRAAAATSSRSQRSRAKAPAARAKAAPPAASQRQTTSAARRTAASTTSAASQRGTRQTKLNFSEPASSQAPASTFRAGTTAAAAKELSDDEISDDDPFEPMIPTTRRR